MTVLLIAFGAMTSLIRGTAFASAFPHYPLFFLFFAMITIERIYAYSRAVSQRHMIARDLISTTVQVFIAGAVMSTLVFRVWHFIAKSYLGRGSLFAVSNALGPLWAQVLAVFLLSSLWGYWMHRFQHANEFLWKLHGYHHSVTHVQISNLLVSNPFDWALRNLLGGLLLSVVGFNPMAIVIAGTVSVYGNFSHCGGDMKGGWLNYFFNTPEVHRWHHSVEFPDTESFGYGCNFGVETSFWDIIFGTFYLPKDQEGHVIPPPRIGHPSGYADEPNYLKMLLATRAFPSFMHCFCRSDHLASVPAERSGLIRRMLPYILGFCVVEAGIYHFNGPTGDFNTGLLGLLAIWIYYIWLSKESSAVA